MAPLFCPCFKPKANKVVSRVVMEGRMVVVEGHLEAVEVAIAETKADTRALRQETTAIRQDVQAILKALGERNHNHRGLNQGESQSLVNDNGVDPTAEGEEAEKRVELPVFEGGALRVWIGRAEKFFEVQKVAEEEKLEVAFISMEGYAGSWFRFWALGIRFGGGTRGTVQVGPVEEYIRDFEVLVGQTTQIPEEQIMGYFLSGLREEVGDHVRPHDPPDLMTAISCALLRRRAEDGCPRIKILGEKRQSNRDPTVREGPVESVGSVKKGATQGGNNVGTSGSGSDRNVRNLPYSEYINTSNGGKRGDVSGAADLLALAIAVRRGDEETENDGGPEMNITIMKLSTLSAGGLTSPRTMKLRRRIGRREVLVLIDSGTSHNFISQRVVEDLEMAVVETQPYMVSLGDRQKKRINGCCEQATLKVGDAKIVERFYIFELGGVEVILSVEWLRKLGKVTVDWKILTMVYRQGEEEITIKGDPTLERKMVGPRTLLKRDEVAAGLRVWELASLESRESGQNCLGLNKKQKEMELVKIKTDKYIFEGLNRPSSCSIVYIDKEMIQ
ncbi:hypothetical protein V8G54_018911 [Vigna mungo]|uniref:Uncharacterized protein n=1 Tax=Vigna mungo TaxID=3915 RepID=A0AAQ3N8Y9_VIGMU